MLSGGALSYSLKKFSTHESLAANVLPIITNKHLNAIDRRLLTVFAVVEFCLKSKQYHSDVIIDQRVHENLSL